MFNLVFIFKCLLVENQLKLNSADVEIHMIIPFIMNMTICFSTVSFCFNG